MNSVPELKSCHHALANSSSRTFRTELPQPRASYSSAHSQQSLAETGLYGTSQHLNKTDAIIRRAKSSSSRSLSHSQAAESTMQPASNAHTTAQAATHPNGVPSASTAYHPVKRAWQRSDVRIRALCGNEAVGATPIERWLKHERVRNQSWHGMAGLYVAEPAADHTPKGIGRLKKG
jgi:hypothetical protein